MKKKQTVADLVQASKILRRNGIHIHGMFVLGFDDDDWASIKKTVRFAKKVRLSTTQFLILTPLPGIGVLREDEVRAPSPVRRLGPLRRPSRRLPAGPVFALRPPEGPDVLPQEVLFDETDGREGVRRRMAERRDRPLRPEAQPDLEEEEPDVPPGRRPSEAAARAPGSPSITARRSSSTAEPAQRAFSGDRCLSNQPTTRLRTSIACFSSRMPCPSRG